MKTIRLLLAALVLLAIECPVLAEPLIGAQAIVYFPDANGTPDSAAAPDALIPAAVNLASATYGVHDVAIGTGTVTNTGLMASQSLIAMSAPSGTYGASAQTVYQVTFTPTATGTVAITFNLLPQILQVYDSINSRAQITTSVLIRNTLGGVERQILYSDVYVEFGSTGFNKEFGDGNHFQGSDGSWFAEAYTFTYQYAGLANVPFTLEYNILTFATADFDSTGIGAARFEEGDVIAQFGDPLNLNNINVRFDAADVSEVPEPATIVSLLVMGAVATMGSRLRRRAS